MSLRVAVVSDTHFPRRGRALPEACRERIAQADLVVHGGDFADVAALAELDAIGTPIVAVAGNADDAGVRRSLPQTAEVEVGGVRIGVVHNAGSADGRLARLRRKFPDCAIVVFGHSHVPLIERAPDGFTIVNPGSATDRRRQPRHTMAEIVIADGVATATIIPLD